MPAAFRAAAHRLSAGDGSRGGKRIYSRSGGRGKAGHRAGVRFLYGGTDRCPGAERQRTHLHGAGYRHDLRHRRRNGQLYPQRRKRQLRPVRQRGVHRLSALQRGYGQQAQRRIEAADDRHGGLQEKGQRRPGGRQKGIRHRPGFVRGHQRRIRQDPCGKLE